MTDRLMIYDELAVALGRTPEAARQLAKRKRWRRVVGNDGRARVSVPLEALELDRSVDQDTTGLASDRPTIGRPPVDRPDVTTILTGHISRLERELEALKQEHNAAREGERALALQLEALKAALEAERAMVAVERERSSEWKAVADRFASQAERLTAATATRGWWPFRRRA